ncbi:MAG: AAA family ATPase [Actinomycetia bacterium]|nr:AAA family ATPase [Actinomycetes bacterium]MCP5030593.1 AAA family ATPase [Actinomycetes bacterium]
MTRAVQSFVDELAPSLGAAASGSKVDADEARQLTLLEAFNLCTAFIDVDDRHTDDELWALVAAFAQHGHLAGVSTPRSLRANSIVAGKQAWLDKPSDLFETLRQADRVNRTHYARSYYDAAMTLAHTVASLDQYPSEIELKAIVAYQRLLLAALPTLETDGAPKPTASTTGGEAGSDTATTPAETKAEHEQEPPEPLEDLLAELDALIGLDAVKEEVKLLSALLRVQRLRAERDLPVVDKTNHLIFSGNPGTGKTTVARLLARIYRSLGVVERGHLVEVDRSGLVAGFVGQTATRVADVFTSADGGVLLIDEAYSLTRGGERDFGREAIDAVVKQVEDRRDSMVVILAGYPKEMAELVATNPGFQSRFPRTILFPDYSDSELVAILELIAGGGTYHLTDEATEVAEAWFGSHSRGRGFGNGRLARNLFEAAVARHATRLVDVETPTDEELTTLEGVDIASVPVGNRVTNS